MSEYRSPEVHRGLEIITPSYAADLELCKRLARSIREFAPSGTRHTVIVPPGDEHLFRAGLDAAVVVTTTDEFLPAAFRRLPRANMWIDLRRPIYPIRGWIAQQIIKLAAAARCESTAALIVDSDLEFIRPFDLPTFAPGGTIPLYRLADAVHDGMPRHITWDGVARNMLGVPRSAGAPLPDYICWPCLWDTGVVRALLQRVEEVGGRAWQTTIGASRHFSEMVLYGVFVDEVEAAQRPIATTMKCPSYSSETPLDDVGLHDFLGRVATGDVAVMISAKSGTDLSARDSALSDIREV